MRYEAEIDKKGHRVNDGGDQRRRHDRRVELDLGCHPRQRAADGFREDNYEHEGYADDSRDIHRELVYEHELDEIG